MPQPKFIDIVRATGLEQYLTDNAAEYNGIGWDMFDLMMKKNTSAYRIHVLMDTPRARVDDFIKLYREKK